MRAFACLVVICALTVSPAAFANGDPKTISEGRLVTGEKQKLVDVPLEHTDVHIRVDGHVAETRVTQRFRNPYAYKIEAVYLFPLPTGAAVNDLSITSGARVIRGQIQERAKATRVYEAARKQGYVAALLTQERPNLFTQSVANLEPSTTIEVTLRYVQRLEFEDGGYSLAFPMVVGPRYLPAASQRSPVEPHLPASPVGGAKPLGSTKPDTVNAPVLPTGLRSTHDISLRVDIDAGIAIEELTSTSHRISIDRAAPSRATVRIQRSDTIPNKDFTLRYLVAGSAPKFAVIGHRDPGAPGSFLLVAQPPATATPAQIAPREIVFVLDTSSSMRGAPLAKAKELIRRVLWTLRPDDTFQIVRFSDKASALGKGPISAKPKNIELTLRWLSAIEAGGGTEMTSGVQAALTVPHDPLRLRILAFITDGYVGNEDDILASVGKHVGTSRLFSFGVGSSVNRYLLEEMASIGRGAAQFVRPDEDTARAVTSFERRIDTPVLTDVRVEWGGLPVTDVVPHAIPDLFVGQPLVLSGRYTAGGSGTVVVRGKQAGRDVRFEVPVALPDKDGARPAIGTIWARSRIADLSRKLVRKSDAAIEREILTLSLEHRVLTRFTAFVAVDDSRATTGDAKKVVVPVEVPDAVANVPTGNYGGEIYGELAGSSYSSGGGGYSFGPGGGGTGWGTIGTGTYGKIGNESSIGWGTPRPNVAVPTVTITQPRVSGALDAAIIRRYVNRQKAKLRYCYEKALLRSPTLAGTTTVSFLIDANGIVRSSSATSFGDQEVATCVATVIKSIEFPKAVDGAQVQVHYPFTFAPAKETK